MSPTPPSWPFLASHIRRLLEAGATTRIAGESVTISLNGFTCTPHWRHYQAAIEAMEKDSVA